MGPNPGVNKSWKGKPTTNYLNGSTSSTYPNAFQSNSWVGTTTEVGVSKFNTNILQWDSSSGSYTYTRDQILDDDLGTLSNQTVTFSMYIRRLEGAATGRIRVYDNSSSYSYQSISVTPQFQRVEMTKTLGANPTRIFVMLDNSGGGTYQFHSPQLEISSFATPFAYSSRSNTESLLDWTGNNTITADSLTYNSDGSFSFDGSGDVTGNPPGDYISVPENITKTDLATYPSGCTYNFWLKVDDDANNRLSVLYGAGTIRHIEIYSSSKSFRTEAATQNNYSFGAGSFPDDVRGSWSNFSIVFANNESGRPVRWYQNGSLFHTHSSMESGSGGTSEYFSFNAIGRATGSTTYTYAKSFKGQIPIFQIYNKSLTSQEIKQNYNALRGRFGI